MASIILQANGRIQALRAPGTGLTEWPKPEWPAMFCWARSPWFNKSRSSDQSPSHVFALHPEHPARSQRESTRVFAGSHPLGLRPSFPAPSCEDRSRESARTPLWKLSDFGSLALFYLRGPTTAVSGAGPTTQRMQPERTLGVHSTALAGPLHRSFVRSPTFRSVPYILPAEIEYMPEPVMSTRSKRLIRCPGRKSNRFVVPSA